MLCTSLIIAIFHNDVHYQLLNIFFIMITIMMQIINYLHFAIINCIIDNNNNHVSLLFFFFNNSICWQAIKKKYKPSTVNIDPNKKKYIRLRTN